MIRLTLNPQTEPEIHLFNKSMISIGAESTHADLILTYSGLRTGLLKIVQENKNWFLINEANDPFILLNDLPFGKKTLRSGDLIYVHQQNILFEILPAQSNTDFLNSGDLQQSFKEGLEESSTFSNLNSSVEEGYPSIEHIVLPFEHEVEALKSSDWQQGSLEDYILKLEQYEKKKQQPDAPLSSPKPFIQQDEEQKKPSLEESPSTEPKKRVSLKDDYLRDLDDDQQDHSNTFSSNLPGEPSHLFQAWKWILLFIFSIFSISGAVGVVIYYSVSDKTEAHETKAMQGTADIAMALTHAQLSNAKPHNHNWSDLEFLKNNLQNLLPNTHSFAAKLDVQGQFNCCPYNLRIYTNSDLSHFLLIAQPAPSLLYWLIPKPIIVLDSQLMELHTLKDVRSLNRLLAMNDPLDGLNGREITALVKQGNVIPLKSLAKDSGLPEFSPPEDLISICQGAENLIYNAPRYYRIGQSVIQKTGHLSSSKSSSQEVAALKQEIELFNFSKPIVLYTQEGKKSALQSKQGLDMLYPNDKIFFGYLNFNEEGKISQANILSSDEKFIEEEPVMIAYSDLSKATPEEITLQSENRKENTAELFTQKSMVDDNHPIYIQLNSLKNTREQELRPLAQALIKLINSQLYDPNLSFQTEFQTALNQYMDADANHIKLIKDNINHLCSQYEEIPAEDFLKYIQILHFDHLIQEKETIIDVNCHQNIETLLMHIKSSKNISDLENYMSMSFAWLNFDYLKDPQELIKYQTILRNALLKQLQLFLLSPSSYPLKISHEDREKLTLLLNQEKFIKPEEKEFFMNEFEYRTSSI